MCKRLALIVLSVLALASCRSREKAVEELQTRLTNETSRLEARLRAIDKSKLPEDVAGLGQGYQDSFARIRGTKSPMLRLYRMRDTFIGIENLAFFVENRKAGDDMASLQALVANRKPAYEAKEESDEGPLLYRALIEQATNRGRVLYTASAPYGKISDPMWGGLYYLGDAEGNLKFRDFVRSLPKDVTPDHEAGGDRNRLMAAADQLGSETLAFFEKDPTGRGAIPASAKLKEVRELLAAKLDDGATLALVETKLALGRSKAAADPGSVHEGAKPQAHAKDPEESIPALLQAYVKEGPPPVNAVVARDVVPFYASLLQPLAASKVVAPAAVTVTLVRWPYT
jgi:hypothetical protein